MGNTSGSGMIMTAVMMVLLAYMVIRTIRLSMKNKKNNRLLKILGEINQEEQFFKDADQVISTDTDKEFAAKIEVLRLFGDAYYRKEAAFRQHLATLNVDTLMHPQNGKSHGFSENEDSFFYLYTAIPNSLYSSGRNDLRRLLDEKMEPYREENADTLLVHMHDSFAQYYEKQGDLGRKFCQDVLNGDYGQFRYNKQLIGLYKDMMITMLCRIALDENNAEEAASWKESLKNFSETRLGARWMKELNVSLEENKPEENGSEEKKEEKE